MRTAAGWPWPHSQESSTRAAADSRQSRTIARWRRCQTAFGQQATLGEQARSPVPEFEDHGTEIGSFRSLLEQDFSTSPLRGDQRVRSIPTSGDSSQAFAGGSAGMPRRVGWPRTGPVCEWSMWLFGVLSSRSRAASAVSP